MGTSGARSSHLLSGLVLLAALSACSSGSDRGAGAPGAATDRSPAPSWTTSAYEERGYYKIGRPYQISGIWYTPREQFSFSETGIASWYGSDFNGMPTANGEKYDMYAMTAAHPTLQLPSVVRVTNLENGQSVVVRVNDRGPFANSRVIDLSYAAAEKLGFARQGTTQVRIDLLPEASRRVAELARDGADVQTQMAAVAELDRPKASSQLAMRASEPRSSTSSSGWGAKDIGPLQTASYAPAVQDSNLFIQAGAFAQRENAVRLSLALSQFGQTRIDTVAAGGRDLHRVRLGPLENVASADSTLSSLQRNGYSLAQIVVE